MNCNKCSQGICPACLQTVNVISDDATSIVCKQKLKTQPESPMHTLLHGTDPRNYTIAFHVVDNQTCPGYNCTPLQLCH